MAPEAGSEDRPEASAGRRRLVAFRIAAGLFTVAFLAGLLPALGGFALNWLPDAAFLRVRSDLEPGHVVHRLHSIALAVLSLGMILGAGVQLHAPGRKLGAMLMALAVPPALALGEALTGTFTVLGAGVPFALLVVIALLHPHASDLLRVRGMDPVMAGVALVGALPWIGYGLAPAAEVPSGPEWEVAHYGFVSSLGVVTVLWSLIGALDQRGWLWPAAAAGVAGAIVALQSLIFPYVLSGLSPAWAGAALLWVAAYLAAAVLRRRRRGPVPDR